MSNSTNIISSDKVNGPRKVWPITGGVHPQENKQQSTRTPVADIAIPEQLVFALSQHAGSPAEPVVKVGDKVLKGQVIARATGFVSAPVHASTSGTVIAIENRPVPHPSNMHDQCIVLESDGEDRWCELNPVADFRQESPETLIEHIRQAGVSGMGGAGFPTSIKLAPATPVHTLVLNGTECEPYITSDDMLMREQAQGIFEGAEILMHILGAQECLIGIEDNKPHALHALRKAQQGFSHLNIDTVVFPTIYPSGGEKQLIQILTGEEVPSGKLPADLGMVVQNVGTAVAINDAIRHGKPLISRITTLTGEALAEPQNFNTLIGTPARNLLRAAKADGNALTTLVVGGPMMGFMVDNLNIPVTKTTNCLIAGTDEEFPRDPVPQPCIRCGMCAEACPSSLLPQQLFWHARADNIDQLMHHNLFDCIECGACSFVCPSSIPLVQYYRAAKGSIRLQEAKHQKSERSKARYEARLARIEQEKAEKEAKRKANAERAAKLKAEKAKAAVTGKPETLETPEEDDPVKAAIARAKARKAAAAGSPASTTKKPAKPVLTPKQKELKIQLAMAKAQLKKSERALAAAEASGEGDIDTLKANIQMLSSQVGSLQKEFDTESSVAPQPAPTAKPEKKAKPVLSDDEKRRKIERAMANAALRKAERALATALEQGNESTEALKQTVEECKTKLSELDK